MATSKEAPKKEPSAPAEAAPPKSKKLLIIIVIGVVLLCLIIGAGFFLFKKKTTNDGASDNSSSVEESSSSGNARQWPPYDPNKPPVFVALEPFTVNLQSDDGAQYLQVVASLRVIDEKVGEEIKAYMPQIRHEILSLLAGKKASEITSPDDREELAQEIKDTVNQIMGFDPPDTSKKKRKVASAREPVGPVVSVFFTQFIVQ